jgi:outer membrane receptor for ferrienterochelin and colicins
VQLFDGLRVRANYTLTDSEQKSGSQAGLPLGNSARHMANASVDWQATNQLSFLLTGEWRSKRYRSLHAITGDELYYKSYTVLNLGAAYEPASWLTVNARVNNLLNRDFTTYNTEFRDLTGDGDYLDTNETLHFDHYNNKDKARSFWLSVTARF